MDNWFTIERIDDETYSVGEYKHREEAHSYLLTGKTYSLLIDTGLGVSDIKTAINAITDLPVSVITTHVHWDHIGGHKYFPNFGVHKFEEKWINGYFPLSLTAVKQNLTAKPCEFPVNFNIDDYTVFQGKPKKIFVDNDVIDLDGRKIRIIHTPGHSPGHCCFYDETKKYLFSGDLIYKGCLDMFYPTTDKNKFMQSIKKTKRLDIRKILPAHHSLNIQPDIIEKIDNAFKSLSIAGKFDISGIYDFGEFQLHI